MRLHDDRKIEFVLAEYESGFVDEVAMIKALKSAKGDESYARALSDKRSLRRSGLFRSLAV